VKVYVGLGSNVGGRLGFLRRAVRALGECPGVRVTALSRLYETSPVGPRQRNFLNAAAELRVGLTPEKFLAALKGIEKKLGRRPRQRWGPREVDLDILLWGNRRVHRRDLEIPHPRLAARRFVLAPLVDLAPGRRHPVLRRTLRRLERDLTAPDQRVKVLSTPLWPPCPPK
jgi:2-amino-4-hydroxy-6-hydroxymethyldihydropteridine diphosphokinase